MRKAVQSIIVIAAFLLSTFLGISIYKKIIAKNIADKNTSTLPAFSFATVGNKTFSNEDLSDTNSKIIINYFNPACEHCQYMAKSYVKNADKLNDISLIMITIADSSSISKFRNDYHLDSLHNITFLRDPKLQFEKIFGTSSVPSFFIYKDRKLVKKIIGETKIENLLN
jgi:thiol-disulfide isomerase/thioredoxin